MGQPVRKVECGFVLGFFKPKGPEFLINIGPTLPVRIGFDQDFESGGDAPPNLPATDLLALVDTGAAENCIDSALALKLGLPIIEKDCPVAGVHGAEKVDAHMAQIYISSLKDTVYGRFFGVHLSKGGQIHHALLGRSFLKKYRMIYKGDTGSVTLEQAPLETPISN